MFNNQKSPTRLDAEVAVRCFGWQWWVAKRTMDDTKKLCVIHVPDSWLESGWIRFNWSPEFHELLNGVVWPKGDYKPFEDWHRCVGKEYVPDRGQLEWSAMPLWSQQWKACGMVIEWLIEHAVQFSVSDTAVQYKGTTYDSGDDLKKSICMLAVEVAKNQSTMNEANLSEASGCDKI